MVLKVQSAAPGNVGPHSGNYFHSNTKTPFVLLTLGGIFTVHMIRGSTIITLKTMKKLMQKKFIVNEVSKILNKDKINIIDFSFYLSLQYRFSKYHIKKFILITKILGTLLHFMFF